MCNKIAANFIPNNEGLFSIFHLFPTCSIQVPNGFPLVTPFFIRGSHKMVTKKVLVTIRGRGGEAKKEKMGVGGRERHCGDSKVFDYHMGVATKNLLATTQLW